MQPVAPIPRLRRHDAVVRMPGPDGWLGARSAGHRGSPESGGELEGAVREDRERSSAEHAEEDPAVGVKLAAQQVLEDTRAIARRPAGESCQLWPDHSRVACQRVVREAGRLRRSWRCADRCRRCRGRRRSATQSGAGKRHNCAGHEGAESGRQGSVRCGEVDRCARAILTTSAEQVTSRRRPRCEGLPVYARVATGRTPPSAGGSRPRGQREAKLRQ